MTRTFTEWCEINNQDVLDYFFLVNPDIPREVKVYGRMTSTKTNDDILGEGISQGIELRARIYGKKLSKEEVLKEMNQIANEVLG